MAELRGVVIEVENADALVGASDVLVLKHAQVSVGVDAAAKERLGVDLELDLPPGDLLVMRNVDEVGPRNVVFLGVPPLADFGYPEIQLFGRRAVSLTVAEFPDCRELALTLHGVGFGLDETACFEAELLGIVEGIEGRSASDLERVAIVEADARRAERLRLHLERAFPATPQRAVRSFGNAAEKAAGPRRWTEPAAARGHAFVAMPFSKSFEDTFHYAIEPAIHSSDLLCERIDEQAFTGSVPERVKEKIRSAALLVADLTGANPNVYLEVGLAWGVEVPTVLVCREGSDLAFDVQSERCIAYRNIKDLEQQLTDELRELVEG
jgi:hypothetical protein